MSYFFAIFNPTFYPIDNPKSCVIIIVEYEITVYKSILSADFRNKVSAFFIFYNTPLKNK